MLTFDRNLAAPVQVADLSVSLEEAHSALTSTQLAYILTNHG